MNTVTPNHVSARIFDIAEREHRSRTDDAYLVMDEGRKLLRRDLSPVLMLLSGVALLAGYWLPRYWSGM